MGANFNQNETLASKRRADLIIYQDDGVTLAPRGTDFTGFIYVAASSPDFDAAAGTLTNKRRPLTFSDLTISSVDTGADNVTSVAHGLETGDGVSRLTNSGGAVPAGLATATDYYIIKDDVDKVGFATTLANAYANTRINITGSGSGTNKIVKVTNFTQRGLDGFFQYQATQAETNVDGSEFSILVEMSGYAPAYTSVTMGLDTSFESAAEGSYTYGDLLRLMTGVLAGKVSNFNTGTLVFKSLDGGKTRLTVTTDSSGRLTVTPGDLT